jgi:hypothetical protein
VARRRGLLIPNIVVFVIGHTDKQRERERERERERWKLVVEGAEQDCEYLTC